MGIQFKLFFSLYLISFQLHSDSVWTASKQHSLFADVRARKKGDIVFLVFEKEVKIEEEPKDAADGQGYINPKNKYPFERKVLDGVFGLTTPYHIPATKYGDTKATIAMQVMDVLPNGNLVLEGVRKYKFWDTYKFEVLRGVVRSSDIEYNNSITSDKVARLTIDYATGNSFEEAKRNGLITNLNNLLDPY